MKKILIITHAFPPGAGSGVIRTLKFVKYLPENGWQPSVLTVDTRYNEKKDSSMEAEIPAGTQVVRTGMFEPLALYREVKKVSTQRGAADASVHPKPSEKRGALVRLRSTIRAFLSTPDRFIGWVIPGTRAGLALVRKIRPDVIYSTSPVETPHIIGLLLKKLTRLPWIIDLRDPWMLRYETQKRNRLLMAFEGWLERSVMNAADAIIANNDFLKARYLAKYGSRIASKLHVVVNGYDSGDFEGLHAAPSTANERFTIAHVGEFYQRMRTPDGFLKAVSELIHEGWLKRDAVRLRFVGAGDYVQTRQFSEMVRELGLQDVLEVWPHQQHRDSIGIMMQSDALLLLQPDPMNKAQIPAKTFEYLRTGRPIIAIAPRDGATSMVLSNFSQSHAVTPQDASGLKKTILDLFGQRENPRLATSRDDAGIRAFDRRDLTKKLAGIADSLTIVRVMHVLPSLETGGMENGVVNLVNALDRKKFSSSICCLERDGPLRERLLPDVRVINLSVKQGIRWFLPLRLGRLLRREKIDIVHTHNFYTLVYATLAARLFGIASIVHGEHGRVQAWPSRRKKLTRLLSKSVDRVLTVSQSLKDMLINDGVSPSKIRVIPNGIDVEKYRQPEPLDAEKASLGIRADDLVIGSVGRLVPVKDYKTLIRAFALVRQSCPRAFLLIAGDGIELPALRACAEEKRCEDRVHFLGQRSDVASLYRFMRVFALSSLSEGMSNVIMEAMASRVPVVATKVGDNEVLVEDGKTGLLVEPGDPRVLADALIRLLTDAELASRMAGEGHRKITENFSIVRMVNAYAEIYQHPRL